MLCEEDNLTQQAFEQIALGRLNTEQVWKPAKEGEGFSRGSKNNFGWL